MEQELPQARNDFSGQELGEGGGTLSKFASLTSSLLTTHFS